MSSTMSWSGVGLSPPGASSPTLYADSQSASTSPPVSAGPVSVCSAYRSRSVRRPLRADDAVRSRSSDEGGVDWTMSSSLITRRSRFKPGALRTSTLLGAAVRFAAACPGLRREAGADCLRAAVAGLRRAVLRGAAFGAARLTALRAAALRALARARGAVALRPAFRARAVFLTAFAGRRGPAFLALARVRPAAFRLTPAFFRPAREAFRLAIRWSFRYRPRTRQLP